MSKLDKSRRCGFSSTAYMRRTRKEQTAYHEAGHAVLAIVVGAAIHEVSIVPNGDFGGHCFVSPWRGRKDSSYWETYERYVVVLLAGVPSQVEWVRGDGGLGDLDPSVAELISYNFDGGKRDWEEAEKMVRSAVTTAGKPGEFEFVLKYLSNYSRDLVRRCWPIIDDLARELLARQVMNGAEVRRVCLAPVVITNCNCLECGLGNLRVVNSGLGAFRSPIKKNA